MFSRLSIRARITIGSVLVAAVLLTAALLIVRAQVASILTAADVSLAQSDLQSFEKDVTAHPDEPVDDPGTGILVAVRDPKGTVQVNTLPHDLWPLVEHRAPADEQFTATDDEGRSFVIVGRALPTSAGTWAMWSARSTSSSELALEGLDRVLVIGGLVLLLCFGLAAWLLASLSLRPVTAMRRRAEQLGATSADAQLPVGPARDELAELATTLNAFLRRVQDSAAREKQMVSDAAHELRTPLAALKTQLELAHGDAGDAAALSRQLGAAELSVDRLAALASNLLELSRLEAREVSDSAGASALVTEFLGSIDRARMLALPTATDVSFDLDVADGEARYGIAASAFGRLCDNLLSNAIAAVAGGGSVRAVLRQHDGDLELLVSDDGPGMPESFLPIAFERFTRPDDSRTAATGGSGLGLSLVQALAREAGGDATLHNAHPGLVVTVTLPKM